MQQKWLGKELKL